MKFFALLFLVVLEVALSLFMSLVGMWVLHATDLPVLTTITYWQTFGIMLFISMATAGNRISSK